MNENDILQIIDKAFIEAKDTKNDDNVFEIAVRMFKEQGIKASIRMCDCCDEIIGIIVDGETYDKDGSTADYGYINDSTVCLNCEENIMQGEDTRIKIFIDNKEIMACCYRGFYYIDEEYQTNDEINKCIDDIATNTKWHSTDGWRGYLETKPKNMTQIIDGVILSGHHSELFEKQRYDLLVEALNELKIPLYVVFNRTSNLFSTGIDYFVANEHKDKALEIAKCINTITKADDPRWNIGVLFSHLQNSPLTEKVVDEMSKSIKKNKEVCDNHVKKLKEK